MIVEDDALLALDIADALQHGGLVVLGPFSSVDTALRGMAARQPDLAVLDIDLHGQMSFPVADALAAANVPFLWLSASSPSILPAHHQGRPFLSKPFGAASLLSVVSQLLKTS